MTNSTEAKQKKPNIFPAVARGAFIGLLLGAGTSVIPLCGIRRVPDLVLRDPIQVIFFVEWTLTCAITGGALLLRLSTDNSLQAESDVTAGRTKRLLLRFWMPVSATLFLLLYTAASGLCQRLGFGVITGSDTMVLTIRTVGLLVASIGLCLQIWALLVRVKPSSESAEGAYLHPTIFRLRHPCFFATLITLTGLPLLLGTWYPLFALPGIFVTFKWISTDQERRLTEKFGERYEQYKKETHQLLPNIF